MLFYSVSSAVGQNFIYYTITQFNPLVLTTARRDPPEIRRADASRVAGPRPPSTCHR